MARKKPATEALQAALDLALDQAHNSGEPHWVFYAIYSHRYLISPQSGVITPVPGEFEEKAICYPNGRTDYL